MDLLIFSQTLRDDAISDSAKYHSFIAFKSYYDDLCDFVLKKEIFTDDQLAHHLFAGKWQPNIDETVFKKHLYAAKMTLSRYHQLVTEENFASYKYALTVLAHSLFSNVKRAEEYYRKVPLKFNMGARPDQNAREVFDIAEAMLHIGTVDTQNAYLREVMPVSIFLLRQAIEIYGKRTLGYFSITDKNGNRSRSISTQVAWDFIKTEVKKKDARIKLPTNIDTIIKVEEWTNRYVHTGDIPRAYQIENAIHFVKKLIYPLNNSVKDFQNIVNFYGTTRISKYNSVKADFERFVNPAAPPRNPLVKIWSWLLIQLNVRKKPKEIIVNWMPVRRIDATILSL